MRPSPRFHSRFALSPRLAAVHALTLTASVLLGARASAEQPAGLAPSSSPPETVASVSAEPGRGLTIVVGDRFSMNLRPRVQLRNTTAWHSDEGVGRHATNEVQPRTLRLWFTGNVLDPNVKYGIQLAFGSNDFDTGSPSPIFDAFIELTHLRDLNVRVGQFFVPFDRARTIRESSLQTVDRATVVRELTLDRDVGVVLQSQDLLGLGGKLFYHLGLFGGEGRNRFGGSRPGFLYTARFGVRAFGAFDDDQEGDLSHQGRPRLMIGVGAAYDQNAIRQRGTTGSTYTLGGTDYLSLEADAVFKWRGLYLLGEVLYRNASTGVRMGTDANGDPMTELARNAHGFLAQGSYGPISKLDFWLRYDRLYARDPVDTAQSPSSSLAALVATAGQGIATGANWYVNQHMLKLQLDYAYAFGQDVGVGAHAVRAQVDATF